MEENATAYMWRYVSSGTGFIESWNFEYVVRETGQVATLQEILQGWAHGASGIKPCLCSGCIQKLIFSRPSWQRSFFSSLHCYLV